MEKEKPMGQPESFSLLPAFSPAFWQELESLYADRVACLQLHWQSDLAAFGIENREPQAFWQLCMLLEHLWQSLDRGDQAIFGRGGLVAHFLSSCRAYQLTPDYLCRRPEQRDLLLWHYLLAIRVNEETPYPEDLAYLQQELQQALPQEAYKSGSNLALAVNAWLTQQIYYEPTDSRTLGALATLWRGRGRCGEESTLLVRALRAVGLPARQCYVPRWLHMDDNHAWVEVWADGAWHHMGAAEAEPALDHAWYNEAAQSAPLMVARRYGLPLRQDPEKRAFLPWNGKAFQLLNVTSAYVATRRIDFDVEVEREAELSLYLPNFGRLDPLWSVQLPRGRQVGTWQSGQVTLLLRYRSQQESCCYLLPAEATPITFSLEQGRFSCQVGEKRLEALQLSEAQTLVFHWPVAAPASAWPPHMAALGALGVDSLQNEEQPPTANWAADFSLAEAGISEPEAVRTFITAELALAAKKWPSMQQRLRHFDELLRGEDAERYALLLSSLRRKDLVDVAWPLLEERVERWKREEALWQTRAAGLDTNSIRSWQLSPRVADEALDTSLVAGDTAGQKPAEREALAFWAERWQIASDPMQCRYLLGEIAADPAADRREGVEAATRYTPYRRLFYVLYQAMQKQEAVSFNRLSLDVAAVALLREWGYPARLLPLGRGLACYWQGQWQNLPRHPKELLAPETMSSEERDLSTKDPSAPKAKNSLIASDGAGKEPVCDLPSVLCSCHFGLKWRDDACFSPLHPEQLEQMLYGRDWTVSALSQTSESVLSAEDMRLTATAGDGYQLSLAPGSYRLTLVQHRVGETLALCLPFAVPHLEEHTAAVLDLGDGRALQLRLEIEKGLA